MSKVLVLNEEVMELLNSIWDAVLKGHGIGAIDAVNRMRYLVSVSEQEAVGHVVQEGEVELVA